MNRIIVVLALVVLIIISGSKAERKQNDILWHVIGITATGYLMFVSTVMIVAAYARCL